MYTKPRPFGLEFDCKRPRELFALARSRVLNEDEDDTAEGEFSAGQTQGTGFREIGSGPRLHLELAMEASSMSTSIHMDTWSVPGSTTGIGGLEHGYWDLLSDKAPGCLALLAISDRSVQ